jgi:putative transposase
MALSAKRRHLDKLTGGSEEELEMARGRRRSPEQIASLLRQIELDIANGNSAPFACNEAGIAEQTFYRWRGEWGGLKVGQVRRLKELVRENMKLKRQVAELSLCEELPREPVRKRFQN